MTSPSDPRLLRTTMDEVRSALAELCDVQVRSVWREDGTVTRHVYWSLLEQLRRAVAGSSNRGGRRRSSSSSPLDAGALDLWDSIGARMTLLLSDFDARPEKPGVEAGLRAVVAAAGGSTDLEALLGLRGFLRAWCNSIRSLIDPPRRVPLWGHACPVESCGESTVWRVDESDGELKRAAALEAAMEVNQYGELEVTAVRCLACDEPWPRSKLHFLARLLGRDVPGFESEETGEVA